MSAFFNPRARFCRMNHFSDHQRSGESDAINGLTPIPRGDRAGADLSGLHLAGAQLEGQLLPGANLSRSLRDSICLDGADLSNACLAETVMEALLLPRSARTHAEERSHDERSQKDEDSPSQCCGQLRESPGHCHCHVHIRVCTQ